MRKAELGVIADRLRADGLTVQTQAYYDAADTAILAAARQKQADLIVMSTHGRSGLNRWVYGSVADAVLRVAPIPVLLVPMTCTTPMGDRAAAAPAGAIRWLDYR